MSAGSSPVAVAVLGGRADAYSRMLKTLKIAVMETMLVVPWVQSQFYGLVRTILWMRERSWVFFFPLEVRIFFESLGMPSERARARNRWRIYLWIDWGISNQGPKKVFVKRDPLSLESPSLSPAQSQSSSM